MARGLVSGWAPKVHVILQAFFGVRFGVSTVGVDIQHTQSSRRGTSESYPGFVNVPRGVQWSVLFLASPGNSTQ
jgi:hypothetical protein